MRIYGYNVVVKRFSITRDWGMTLTHGDKYYRYFTDTSLIRLLLIGVITMFARANKKGRE